MQALQHSPVVCILTGLITIKGLFTWRSEQKCFPVNLRNLKIIQKQNQNQSQKVIALPKNTPDDIYNGWLEIFKQTMADPQTAKEFEAANIQPQNFAGDDAYKYIMKTHDFMKAIIDTGIMKKK